VALDGLSLSVRAGEVFGLLGPNGAGKSTTIGLATGRLAPDSGTVELTGLGSPTRPEVRANLGLAPQSLALYDAMPARENLRFFAQLAGCSRADARERAEALLGRVGLSDRAGDRVGGFSGGMKRRLNLACAVAHRPPIVLLDEPTAGVDPHSRHAIFELVRGLRAEGATVVYTTHYMEEAERLCDRVGVIDRGRLRAVGTVDELVREHGGHSRLTLRHRDGTEDAREVSDPVAALAEVDLRKEAGWAELRIDRPDLETVFLNLTGRTLRD
jgi:ABC-2 type transport system ATP-binding protein